MKPLAEELGAAYTAGDVEEDDFFERAAAEAGSPLAGLVYAVGTIRLGSLGRLGAKDFARDFRVNAAGAALAVKASLPAFRKAEGGASVVLFTSVAARQGFTLHASMGMAKGAVSGLTLSLAAELAPRIRVNAVAPSLTRTPLAEKVVPNEKVEGAVAGLHAIPRLGEPREVAALAAFLLSPESGWITGQIVGVDGGRSALRIKG